MSTPRKLAGAEGSKLSRATPPDEGAQVKEVMAPVFKNKTFRLLAKDLARLRDLVEKVGMASGRRVSEADVVKAGLFLASKATPEELLSAVKDALWD